ncbi:hypothetical protein [Anatilimnocola floriformis]|uniref:hypothetical protein n=1 Tax=Anatilimnocola floriformis TaxID=2948575 RepID=UPI0020C2E0C8|nr:hypothetical protein [Anatilimnocola floriformis]
MLVFSFGNASRRLLLGSGLLIAVALVAGCSQKHPTQLDLPKLHPVSGTVTYQGRPATGFRVIFNPVTKIGKYDILPQTVTDDAGGYKLTTEKPDDGAPEGEYVVTFLWPDQINKPENPDPVPEVDKFRGAYANKATSTFKATVKAGDNVIPVFDLR